MDLICILLGLVSFFMAGGSRLSYFFRFTKVGGLTGFCSCGSGVVSSVEGHDYGKVTFFLIPRVTTGGLMHQNCLFGEEKL